MKKKESKKFEIEEIYKNEVEAYMRLDHPNIIKLLDFSTAEVKDKDKSVELNYMALEYAENGEMMEYISKTGSFEESTARYFFIQLISALEHINTQGLSHQDIKPDNIMLDSEFNLKLADFGFATDKEYSSKMKGTLSYMAPEILANLPYKPKQIDLFAAGVILFMMVTQRLPFITAEPDDEYYSFIIIKDFRGFWAYHALQEPEIINLSDEFKDLFVRMVVVNGNNRPKIKKIKEHRWMKRDVPKHQEIFENFSYRKLIKDGELNIHDIPDEGSVPDLPEIQISDESKVLLNNTEILAEMEKMSKKYTQYYDCEDGDKMMKEVINFAKFNKYSYKVCNEYYRVIFQIKHQGKLTVIQVNILRIPKMFKRCLECICVDGEEEVFIEAFGSLDLYVFRKKHVIKSEIKLETT
mmetsp:Transcript_27464/g.24340  ORF Transcript_27464/g.24340 Transcript_27464/m.24340 type:complete len:411 (+) Transcript_27464:91-1323(+)